MTTVLQKNDVDVVIYAGDHTLPHVYTKINGGVMIFRLEPKIEEIRRSGINEMDANRATMVVKKHHGFLTKRWHDRVNS